MGFTLIKTQKKINDLDSFKNIDDIYLKEFFNDKFINDKIVALENNILICIDGVILNLKELKKKYLCTNAKELYFRLYSNYGIDMIKELRGNFSGIIYDIISKKTYSFTNHLGNKFIYYFHNSNDLIVSTDIFELAKYKKELGYNLNLNEKSCYMMLTFGYMIHDFTLLNDVNKILAGEYIILQNSKLKRKKYFIYDNTNLTTMKKEEIMKEMYERFKYSLEQSFSKEKEENYNHLCFLSGGLDSRMIAIGGNELGFRDISTITFSQNYSLDETIARKISNDYNFDSIIKSLNNGGFLKNINKYVKRNGGQILYSGAAHLVDTIDKVNLLNFGGVHNGNQADIMHGDYIDAPYHSKPKIENWAYSTKLIKKVNFLQKFAEENYMNEEHFAVFNRGINGIYNGSISLHKNIETFEDFTHVDIVSFSMRMDPKYKYKENLFLSMIQKYYKDATNYKWQKWNAKPNKFNSMYMNGPIGKFYRKSNIMLNKIINGQNNKLNMNPYDFWYENNDDLKNYLDKYFIDNIEYLSKYNELKNDCIYLYNNGCFSEKAQVLTLIEFNKILVEEI